MEELERNKRIKEEFSRISGFFEDLAENQKSILMPLIQNAAFMRVTLEDLQQIIAEQGPVEAYQNGANQYGMKQSAALQSYNALVKNYAAVIKSLFSELPPMKRQEAELVTRVKTAEEREAEAQERERQERKREDEIQRAIEYQRKLRELDDRISKAKTQEERNLLAEEKKALSWHK